MFYFSTREWHASLWDNEKRVLYDAKGDAHERLSDMKRAPNLDALGRPCELKARWKRKTWRCEISILGLGDWWVQRRFAQCHISILQTPVTSRCHTMLQWASERVRARRGGQCQLRDINYRDLTGGKQEEKKEKIHPWMAAAWISTIRISLAIVGVLMFMLQPNWL